MILGVGAVESGLLRIITFKTLAITHRCLEMVLYFLPLLRDFFKEKLPDKQNNLNKQFASLIKVIIKIILRIYLNLNSLLIRIITTIKLS